MYKFTVKRLDSLEVFYLSLRLDFFFRPLFLELLLFTVLVLSAGDAVGVRSFSHNASRRI